MATPRKDFTGQRFGRLVAIRCTGERAVRKSGKVSGYIWECKCDCGNTVFAESCKLRPNGLKSCGCLQRDTASSTMKKGDLIGQRFANLYVKEWIPVRERKQSKFPYLCMCDCGNITYAKRNDLVTGNKKSCGCIHDNYSHQSKIIHYTHGKSYTRLYRVWSIIKDRCDNPNSKNYANYGGRGITLCDEWYDFETFEKWAYDNGFDPNLKGSQCSIDRIDVNKGYSPNNCRWTDAKTQRINQRNVKLYEYNGEAMTITEWSRRLGIKYSALKYRLEKKQLTIEQIINEHVN